MTQLSEYWRYIAALSWFELSNAAVALAGMAAAGHAIFRSLDSNSSRAMRCGFVTLTVGFMGQGFGILVPNTWQNGYDALMFGGSLALFVGNRRYPQFIPASIAEHVSIAVTGYSWLIFFLSVQ